jgi:hypothetical protein
MHTEEEREEEKRRGRKGSRRRQDADPYIGAAQPPVDMAVAPTAS